MCKRTIQHYMHHDARIPLALDIEGGHDAPLYAHPLRTKLHTCDVDIGSDLKSTIGGDDDDTDPARPRQCEYHSCCVCRVVVQLCSYLLHHPTHHTVGDEGKMPKIEDCAGFTLEHWHRPLNTLTLTWSQWARARSDAVVKLPSLLTATLVGTATERRQSPPEQPSWRDLQDVVPSRHWRPVFRRDFDLYMEWCAWMFDYLSQLAALRVEDAHALAELRRLGLAGGFAAVDRVATTAANVITLEEFLRDAFRWAATPSL